MSDDNQSHHDQNIHRMKHDGELLRWQKMHDTALHSDTIAAEIGVFVLKMFLVINGGALIAVMGLFQSLAASRAIAGALTTAGEYYLIGLILTMIAAALSYFYQSFITAGDWNDFSLAFNGEPHLAWSATAARWTIAIVIALLCISFGYFIAAGLRVLEALRLLGTMPGVA